MASDDDLGKRSIEFVLLLLMTILLMTNPVAGAETKRVLIDHSVGATAPPDSTQSTAFQMTLTREMSGSVDIDEVSLDVNRYAQPDMEGPSSYFSSNTQPSR